MITVSELEEKIKTFDDKIAKQEGIRDELSTLQGIFDDHRDSPELVFQLEMFLANR